jgi:hypothetical protein
MAGVFQGAGNWRLDFIDGGVAGELFDAFAESAELQAGV